MNQKTYTFVPVKLTHILRLTAALSLSVVLLSTSPLAYAQNDAKTSGFELPSITPIVKYKPKLPLEVYSADGVRIGQYGDEIRYYTPLAQTPKVLQNAILAVEDARFFEHNGVDPKGIARAVFSMVTGGKRQGASTITQQLVRTMVLTREISVERKAKEIALALQVEQALSKQRILEVYMNEIFLGHRSYGFAAAAQTYFDKDLKDISLAQAAMLAGLPQNPSYANPIANFERAVQRQHVVLARMREVGFITDAQLASAKAEKLQIQAAGGQSLEAAHVAEMARVAAVQRFGASAYTSGIKVSTSLYAAQQNAAFTALRDGIIALDRRSGWRGPEGKVSLAAATDPAWQEQATKAFSGFKDDSSLRLALVLSATSKAVEVMMGNKETLTIQGAGLRAAARGLQNNAPANLKIERGALVRIYKEGAQWTLWQWPDAEGTLVAVEPQTGRVRAMVGSFDFRHQPLNHAFQAWRQPGSAFKPFIYSAALEQGIMPATMVEDSPFTADGGWSPQNYDGGYSGTINVREALAKSSNIASIRILEQVGVSNAKSWLTRFGFDAAKHPANLTMALGTGSVTPMQMSLAYAVLANGGYRVSPVLIEKITDGSGKVVFQAPPAQPFTESQRALPARNAWLTGQLLNEVTSTGTAASAKKSLSRSDLYGKTGTTDKSVDAWFVGYQPSLSAAVWLGHSKPTSLGANETGGKAALPIWIDFMRVALQRTKVVTSEAPQGVVQDGADWVYAQTDSENLSVTSSPWRRSLSTSAVNTTHSPAAPPVTAAPAPKPAPSVPSAETDTYSDRGNKSPPATILDVLIQGVQDSIDKPSSPERQGGFFDDDSRR